MFLHTLRVHLQSSEEHDVVKSYTSKEFKGVVALQNIKAILPDDDTCEHHTDDMRNTQFTHHDRGKQNDHQHHKKD